MVGNATLIHNSLKAVEVNSSSPPYDEKKHSADHHLLKKSYAIKYLIY